MLSVIGAIVMGQRTIRAGGITMGSTEQFIFLLSCIKVSAQTPDAFARCAHVPVAQSWLPKSKLFCQNSTRNTNTWDGRTDGQTHTAITHQ